MANTLLTRIADLSQYNPNDKTVLWNDTTESRWINEYSKLRPGEKAIFIGAKSLKGKLLIGTIKAVNNRQSIACEAIQELECSNDQFLQLHEIYPELISRVKANFQPFIHPININIEQLIDDARNSHFVSYFVFSGNEQYKQVADELNINDRIVLVNSSNTLENVKRHTENGLADFDPPLKISVSGLSLNEVLEKNKSIKRKSTRSNNVIRIQSLISELQEKGQYKFTSFFSYYDALFNKLVYGDGDPAPNSTRKILLQDKEMVFKVSMSGKIGEINEQAFTYFNQNKVVVVHGKTKAKATSNQTQGDAFKSQLQIGDYFYLCRGNSNLELIGRITGDAEKCDFEGYGEEGWLQRPYEIVAEAISIEPYRAKKKWWAPNDNSTCIAIPKHEINLANSTLFNPFFNTQFEYITNTSAELNSTEFMKLHLNQILFGPPGTGKTYKLQTEWVKHFIRSNKKKSKEAYTAEAISQLSWWQVLALVLLEGESKVPDIERHTFVKYKLLVSNTKNLNQIVWGQLSRHTIKSSETVEYSKRADPLFFNKKEGSVWYIEEAKKELIEDLIAIYENINTFAEIAVEPEHNYVFTTFHQSLSYEDFIEGIKPEFQEDDDKKLRYTIEKGIFYRCCDRAAKLAGFINLKDALDNYSKEDRKRKFHQAPPYALFIDEINRGNVAAIFGELITLVEEDKRLGEREIIVELPYSKDKFGVPPNLHIIGTMNTADRSVEALDAALRRRFCFEELRPNPKLLSPGYMFWKLLWDYKHVDWDKEPYQSKEKELLDFLGASQTIWNTRKALWEEFKKEGKKEEQAAKFPGSEFSAYNLEVLLSTINTRIEMLLDKDHQIGHSYFMSVNNMYDLQVAFQNKIIPLLQEYFFGDFGKIGLVLGTGFFEPHQKPRENVFASFYDYDGAEFSERDIYKLHDITQLSDLEFKAAIDQLLKKGSSA